MTMSARKVPSPDQRGEGLENEGLTSREAVRQSQRIAIQLHQLIAASITVTTLRSEQDILKSLAGSLRRVFDAEESVVTLDTGPTAPLRAVARRGKKTVSEVPTHQSSEYPTTWEVGSDTRVENGW